MTLELRDGGRVKDLSALLGFSTKEASIFIVKGSSRKTDFRLAEGDTVLVFHSLLGG
jgi:hypothetical protein